MNGTEQKIHKQTCRWEPSIKVLEWQYIGKGETAQNMVLEQIPKEDKIRPLPHTKYKN